MMHRPDEAMTVKSFRGCCQAVILALLMVILSPVFSPAQGISWSVPEDGGTPRDPARVRKIAENEFHIQSSFEEGGESVLRHAISRVDLLCHNAGTAAVPLTLHLDLSGDGQRTDYDTKPESGMRLRDFLFIQTPGQDWRQVNGSTERWVATVKFDVPPGDTKVGLSPWYAYADYLRFVTSLPPHPHLRKQMIGKSDQGREHWELTITDPAADGESKKTIFWHAREHAYESWSSFAMEGLVSYLLSDEAAGFRKNFTIVLHPMTNVDGVAGGFEYRRGYDLPDPRLSATGRLTFATVDRLHPDYAVAWHNWIAPRDRNVVFYTDGENGLPTPRAWLRFTQLFPSLQAAGHRWKDESTPLKYNWEGKQGLSDWNLHQYALKKYGTRIWGWEMPWWNFSPAEVRASGGQFASAFLTTLTEIQADKVPAIRQLPPLELPRLEMHEFSCEGHSAQSNPWRDAALVGEFTSPSGTQRIIDGFYDGGDHWKLRFTPEEEGEWTYQLRGEGVEILQRGKFRCTPATGSSQGFIRIHPGNPYAFASSGGQAFFPMGDTCYGLFDDSPITPALRAEYLATRRARHFNFVRLTIGHSEKQAAEDPGHYWAWGGTPTEPDLDRFNPAFFRKFDGLMTQMRDCGMNAELILLNFYRQPFTNTRLWTPARERLWLRYLTARYAAFSNVFLWTIANEYETHPDGRYRLDFPADVEWAKATARLIKSFDPYRHPVTVHPVVSASRRGESPRAPFDPPWRIGEFFGGDDAIDVLSQQTGAQGEGTVWDEKFQCWTGDSACLAQSLAADRQYRKPVLNSENGYEFLSGSPTGKQQVHHTGKVRRSAWRIVCAGGYFAAGFSGTLGHSDVWNRIDAPNHYTFQVKDEGAAAQLAALYSLVTSLPFQRMQPLSGVTGQALGLGDGEGHYLIYFPQGGKASLNFPADGKPENALWFNPRSGTAAGEFLTEARGNLTFSAPDTSDWALVIQPPKLK